MLKESPITTLEQASDSREMIETANWVLGSNGTRFCFRAVDPFSRTFSRMFFTRLENVAN